ncbi:MAG TPA: hypothetical protein VGJ33_00535 [Candidatus Angelobacter sp.]
MFSLSPPTVGFFNWVKAILNSEDHYFTVADQNCRWTDHTFLIDKYWQMDSKCRAEALGVVSSFVHETTHHVDHLITPYGAAFHIGSLKESLAFKTFATHLLEAPDCLSNRPLILEPPIQCSHHMQVAWRELRRFTEYMDAGQHTWITRIEEGWGKEKRLFSLMNRTLEAVTVNDFLYTVRPPGTTMYLGPVAILEARAMMHSLCWILFTLGYDHSAEEIPTHPKNPLNDELLLFMHTFYRREELRPEYRLVIDLLSGIWGQECFEDLIQNMSIQYLFSAFMLIDGLCWYALQSPPSACDVHEINKSPVARLLLAMIYFEDNVALAVSKGDKFRCESTAAMLTEMEQSSYMRERHLLPVADCLKVTLDEGKRCIFLGYDDLKVSLREHFDHLLRIQQTQMTIRLTHGYNSLLGLPQTGNPALGAHPYVSSESEARDLLQGLHAGPELTDWFTARENLLYKYSPRLEKKSLLLQHLSPV